MNNTELAAKIADDLFGGNNNHQPKAGHLRLYTSIGDNGRYMAGWSEKPMADRIENHLTVADMIPRAEVAAALDGLHAEFDAAIRVAIDLSNVPAASLGGYWRDRLDATIAALGLPEPAACTWTPDGDGVYNTDCSHAFVFDTGTPAENNITFCGYCGKRLVEGVSE